MNKLMKYEIEEVNEQQPFEITDKDGVNWALRKIRALKAEINELDDIAKREIDRINDWFDRETEKSKNSIEYFEGLLAKYMITQDKKSIKMPYGTIRFKKQQPEFKRDDEKIMAVVEDDYIKIKKSLDWMTLKKNLDFVGGYAIRKDTGEALEGIEVIEREDKFEVKLED